ncbi:MAG: transposase [Deltaproteobacteria bacterium]|nr:transposase [Deltaproteobacteria bacterium]
MGKHLPQKTTSALKHFLSALTKPQLKHFLVYLTGLIWLVKFHSTREIASQVSKTLPDNLQRFLNGSAKKEERLQAANQKTLAQMANKTPEVLAVIDDTTCSREGKKIEGLGIHHSADGLVKGQCVVTCVLKVAGQWLAWAVEGYRPKASSPKGEFKSKIELAGSILRDLRWQLHTSVIVLMDSWYTCAPILTSIIEAGWTFVAAIKCNRILEIAGKKISLRHLAKGRRTYKTVRLSKKRHLKVAKRIVWLPKVGNVLLFITKGGAREVRFLITNNLKMTESEMVELYRQRFGIEIFHKDIKQHLAFGHMFMRSWQGAQTHWTLVIIAYNLVSLSAPKRLRGFRQKIRHFRDSVSIENMLRWSKFKRISQ